MSTPASSRSDEFSRLPELAEIIEDFRAVPEQDRLELLFEFSEELPEVPGRYAGHEDEMEQVIECQSPLFLAVEFSDDDDPIVTLIISAPAEAPTTRGFASIMMQGLSGKPASAILGTPDDMPSFLQLTKLLTPLRLRGMSALLGRIKRNITDHLAQR